MYICHLDTSYLLQLYTAVRLPNMTLTYINHHSDDIIQLGNNVPVYAKLLQQSRLLRYS